MWKRPPRVVHIVSDMNMGGVTSLLVGVLPGLAPDFSVTVCCIGAMMMADAFVSAGLEIIGCPVRGRLGPPGLWRLVRLLRRLRPRIVHTHGYAAGITGAVGAKLAGVGHLVAHVHGMRHCDSARRCCNETVAGRFRDCLVFVPRAAMRSYLDDIPRPGCRCAVVYNGAVRPPEVPPEDRRATRRSFGLGDGSKIVLGVGGLVPGKRFDTFLEAAARAIEAVPGTTAVLVGDGGERAPLERKAAELGVAERVIFAGRRNDVPRLMGIGDVFLNTSENEGAFPLVLIEAIMAGLPVVSTNLPSVEEVARGEDFASLFEVGDAARAAEALTTILRDRELAGRMRRSALRKARMFEADVCAGNLKRVYRLITT